MDENKVRKIVQDEIEKALHKTNKSVDDFFNKIDYFIENKLLIDHYDNTESNKIAVNMSDIKKLYEEKYEIFIENPFYREIKKHKRMYRGPKTIYSRVNKKPVRVWIFRRVNHG